MLTPNSLLLLLPMPILMSSGFPQRLIITPTTKSISALEGNKLALTCSTTHTDPFLDARWRDPLNADINKTYGRKHITTRKSPPSTDLIFYKLEPQDAGTYSCYSRTHPNDTTTITLKVIPRVNFSGTPNKIYAKQDKNASLSCSIQASPYPKTILWFHKDTRITSSPKHPIHPNKPETLHITKVDESDQGSYRCQTFRVTPHFSSTEEKHILLEVLTKPAWLYPKQTPYRLLKMNTLISPFCITQANPPAHILWFHNKDRLENGSQHTILSSPNRSTIQLSLDSIKKFGKYTCKATNSEGSAYKHFFFYPDFPSLTSKSVEITMLKR